jgi:glyoxylase-like metal-dependent hydrolase (beta-lactamase superfamily II)
MTTAIALKDIKIHPVVEQQGAFFDTMEFFPTLTKEVLEENRSWLQPTFIDPVTGRLVLCIQGFVIKTPHENILVDSCVGNHKQRPARPFWNMMNSDRFEKNLGAIGLTVNDVDYVMCTHLHVDHVGWNTRLENGRWVPTFPKAKYAANYAKLSRSCFAGSMDPGAPTWITGTDRRTMILGGTDEPTVWPPVAYHDPHIDGPNSPPVSRAYCGMWCGICLRLPARKAAAS